MTFSALLLQAFSDAPQRVQEWERLNFDMQVLLAWCDGELAEEERLGLLMRTQLLDNPAELESRIAMWSEQVTEHGVDHVTSQVFSYFRQLHGALHEPLRTQITDELLQEVLQTVVADRVINEAEQSFIVHELGPLLKLPPGHAEQRLQNAVAGVIRGVRYAEHAFELYLLMWDEAEDSTPAMDLPEEQLDGFPAAVLGLTTGLSLGSSLAVNYILSAIGGVAVVAQVDEFCAHLSAFTPEVRARSAGGQTLQARAAQIVGELRIDGHNPDEAVDTVFHHLIQIFGLVSSMPTGVRRRFRTEVLPQFGVDHGVLLEQARSLEAVNPLLLQNLLEERTEAEAAPRKWWKLWK